MAFSKAEAGKTRIGWIGTGVMGRWMCQHLMSKGYQATVYNRSRDKAKPLLDSGAAWADTPKAVAERSDVVFAIVGFPADVREVFLGAQGALAGSKSGTVLVDMTTSEPSLAREIYQAAKAKGVASVDAPVSGGDVGAKERACRSWSAATRTLSRRCGRCWSAWARPSCIRAPPAPASTPRWSIKS